MERVKILYIILMLLLTGCEGPSKNNEEKASEPKFSSRGNMVIGNILVAELGKTIYKKNEERSSSAKNRKDIIVNKIDNDINISDEEKQELNQPLQNLINLTK